MRLIQRKEFSGHALAVAPSRNPLGEFLKVSKRSGFDCEWERNLDDGGVRVLRHKEIAPHPTDEAY
jgi:hypothetical protein